MAKPTTNIQSSNTDPMSNRPAYLKQDKIDMPVEESIRFPRLKLIQALSPEKTKGNDKYIPGLEEGNFILQSDTVLRHIDGEEGIVVIPLAIRKRYVEYVPRIASGGFVASYDTREEMEANKEASNDIQTTIEFLCIEDGIEEATPFTITFDTVSKLGTAKKWAGYIHQYSTLEGAKYVITGKQVLNKKKQAYYVFEVKPVGWTAKATLDYVATMTPALLPLFSNEQNAEI